MAIDKQPLTFKQIAALVLAKARVPLTTDEIWQIAVQQGLDKRLRSIGKTPTATLYTDLHRDTLSPDSEFVRVGNRPRRYWLESRSLPGEELEPLPIPKPPASIQAVAERDLHPLLAWFADSRMGGVLAKTIYHEKSKKKAFGEWVHPDMVGVLFPRRALENDTALRLSSALSAPLCRLSSYELKLRVDFGNLREAFFQAVSNSSWANEAYLVAADFDDSPEFTEELARLSAAFGIGTIRLNLEDPHSSTITIPAKRRAELDWSTVDKLASMNSDFALFIKNVTDDMKTDIHPKEYDGIPSDPLQYLDDLKKKVKK